MSYVSVPNILQTTLNWTCKAKAHKDCLWWSSVIVRGSWVAVLYSIDQLHCSVTSYSKALQNVQWFCFMSGIVVGLRIGQTCLWLSNIFCRKSSLLWYTGSIVYPPPSILTFLIIMWKKSWVWKCQGWLFVPVRPLCFLGNWHQAWCFLVCAEYGEWGMCVCVLVSSGRPAHTCAPLEVWVCECVS